MVFSFQLAILHLVMQIGTELALGNVVAGKTPGVGVEGGEIHVVEAHADVGVARGRQQIGLTLNQHG